ncbi:TetR/AcrR family transcriptional regulator [Rhodococcus spongiicola]|uniref:TetR/AcrR family transcriptional regulator n=1 Tax=Rhodococcus spongiicola TaxID=2487352 RepID=A0A438AYC8_9NOCA|nr:TetR/AcrR family transcriptional regulator [Rhodococcus spongiicola]RVW03700.1 TetR/AcrR family transcriptional regulator [Rhodococcus spongiicola]
MPRPRVHDLEQLMDAAEKLAVDSGPAAVTVRALSELTSVSNGAIYHAFGSRAGLVGQVWLRAAQRFLTMQNGAVDAALELGTGQDAAIEAVVAAADAPARFLLDAPVSGRFLLTVRRNELLGAGDLSNDLAADIRNLDDTLAELFVRLSRAMWHRADRNAVDVIRDCVVELPGALLLRGRRTPDAAVRQRLAAAVHALLALEPPLPLSTSVHTTADK